MSGINKSRAKLSLIQDKLNAISSDLGLVKCDFYDVGADEAAHETEQAQDAVDGALQSLRAALQYSEEA